MDKCDHKWVMYQPFSGEAYECCANAGCGVTKATYDEAQMSFDLENSYKPVDLTQFSGLNKWVASLPKGKIETNDWYELDTDAPWNDGDKQ